MANKSVVTKVQKREEYFVQFTPDEMNLLGISPRDKFEVEVDGSGVVVLKKMPSIEIDLADLGLVTLSHLAKLSVERQQPVDEVIVDLLSEYLRKDSDPSPA